MERFGTLSQQDILQIENRLNIRLPDDYKEFLKDTNGGIFDQSAATPVPVGSLDEAIYPDVLFGIVEKNELDLLYWNEKYSDELLEGAVLIGFDLMQGFIVLMTGAENSGIYYWDDAYHFAASDDAGNMYRLADDFASFYKMAFGGKARR